MESEKGIFKDMILDGTSEDPRVLRARALDHYLARLNLLLQKRDTREARELVRQLRSYLSVLLPSQH